MSRRSAAEPHVLVVGSGPAGAATAIRLARHGLRVTMTDREDRRPPHGGESLPPAIAPLLAELGVLDDFTRGPHLPSYGNESAWGSDALRMHSFMLSPYGPGWHIDRAAFDSLLLGAAQRAGANLLCGAGSAVAPTFFVDATGRSAHVARRFGVSRAHTDHMVAVVGVLEDSAAVCPGTSLVEAAEQGYWYAAPLPGGRLLCAYLTDPPLWASAQTTITDAWHTLLKETRHVSGRAAEHGTLRSLVVLPAGTSRLTELHGPSWLAVGDAAVSRDPLSSGGIYEALRSGIGGADAIVGQLDGDDRAMRAYAADLGARFSSDLVRRRQVYLREQRFPGSPFWARRQAPSNPSGPRTTRTHDEEHTPWR